MKTLKLVAASWSRSFATAAISCYLTQGHFNLKAIVVSGLAAVLPVALRWLNPNDSSFGVVKN